MEYDGLKGVPGRVPLREWPGGRNRLSFLRGWFCCWKVGDIFIAFKSRCWTLGVMAGLCGLERSKET